MLIKTKKAKRLERERNAAYYEAAINYCRDNETRNDDLYATYVNCNDELHKIEKREKIIAGAIIVTTIVVAGVVLHVYLKPNGEVVAIKTIEETKKAKKPIGEIAHITERKTNVDNLYAAKFHNVDVDGDYWKWLMFEDGKAGIKGSCGGTRYRNERLCDLALRDRSIDTKFVQTIEKAVLL